jgi:hypothetical protein
VIFRFSGLFSAHFQISFENLGKIALLFHFKTGTVLEENDASFVVYGFTAACGWGLIMRHQPDCSSNLELWSVPLHIHATLTVVILQSSALIALRNLENNGQHAPVDIILDKQDT